MTWGDVWPAPAKLNLMLRIVGQRADGYHLLQTVFQFLDFGDQLRFRLRSDGGITRVSDIGNVPAESDLVVRAATLLKSETDTKFGVDIELTKKIPMGAGVGGGSSDAATTLLALDRLWGTSLGVDRLAHLGVQLGADVPVFVRGHAAWAEGVGERLEFIDVSEVWYLVLFPPCHVSTSAIFSHPQLTRDSARITIADFFAGSRENDCLPIVRKEYPEVANAIDWLSKFADARLTGTGAAVFAAFDCKEEAQKVFQLLPENLPGIIARGLNRSPVLELL